MSERGQSQTRDCPGTDRSKASINLTLFALCMQRDLRACWAMTEVSHGTGLNRELQKVSLFFFSGYKQHIWIKPFAVYFSALLLSYPLRVWWRYLGHWSEGAPLTLVRSVHVGRWVLGPESPRCLSVQWRMALWVWEENQALSEQLVLGRSQVKSWTREQRCPGGFIRSRDSCNLFHLLRSPHLMVWLRG